MRNDRWKYVPFLEAVADQTACGNKLQQKFFQPYGKVPIVDQGAKAVAGYSDDTALAWKQSLPVVIFGDHTRAIKYVDYPFILGADGTKVLVPRNGLNSKFLYYYLQKVNLPSQGYARHFSHLKRIEVPVPPVAEQERIVALLDEADEIRKLRAQADRRTADLIPALFHEMFGDPATNARSWKCENFGDLLDRIDGGWSPPCHDKPAEPDVWGVLKLGAVTSCGYRDCENKELPECVAARPELEVRAGDLLFTRKNTHELVAACAFVFASRQKLMLSDLIFRLVLKPGAEVEPLYLWGLLTVPSKRKQVQALASGSAASMPNISKRRLMTLPIEVPPLPMQQEFAQRVTKIRAMEAEQATSRDRLDDLFKSMLHRAFANTAKASPEIPCKM